MIEKKVTKEIYSEEVERGEVRIEVNNIEYQKIENKYKNIVELKDSSKIK